jgi:uncharacterized membrane protein
MEIAFALITAIAYAFDFYLAKKGLSETPHPIVATFITMTVNFFFFIILSLIYVPRNLLKLDLVYLFIVAGLLAPGCARALLYKSLKYLGMAVTSPIVNAEAIYPAILGFLFLNEPVDFATLTGISSVVAGLALLGYETGRNARMNLSKEIHYRYLFYPILSSLFYGSSIFIRKLGLNLVSSPILGATFTSGTSWLIFAALLARGGNGAKLLQIKKRSLLYFVMGGCVTCVGWFCLFQALSIGRVSIVTPVATSYSVIILILNFALLRNLERVTPKMVMATILVVGGIALLSLVK